MVRVVHSNLRLTMHDSLRRSEVSMLPKVGSHKSAMLSDRVLITVYKIIHVGFLFMVFLGI